MSDHEDASASGPAPGAPIAEAAADDKTEKQLLMECIAAFRALAPAGPNHVAIRASKLEKLYGIFISKHSLLIDYKPYDSIDVRRWLIQFDAAIDSHASGGCSLDLEAKPLAPNEYVRLLKTKISFLTQGEILQSLRTEGREWNTASILEVKAAMLQLYEKR